MDAIYAVLGAQASVGGAPAEGDPRIKEVALQVDNPSTALMALHGALVDGGLDQMRVLVLLHMGNDPPMTLMSPGDSDPAHNMAKIRRP